MSNILSFTVGILFMVGMLSSCSKQSVQETNRQTPYNFEIKGQIFVIQKNRVNVKMGGVDFYYVPASSFRDRAKWIALNQEKAEQLTNYRLRLDQIENRLRLVEPQDYASKLDQFMSATRGFVATARNRYAQDPRIQEMENLRATKEENNDLFLNSAFSKFQAEQWALTAIYFDWLIHSQTATSVTDADGNYSIKVPANEKGYLIAQASRLLGRSESENYFWIQEVDGKESGPIHLTTNNLLTPDVLEGMLRQSTPRIRSSVDLIAEEFKLPKISWFEEAETSLREMDSNQNQISLLETEIKSLDSKLEEIRIMSTP